MMMGYPPGGAPHECKWNVTGTCSVCGKPVPIDASDRPGATSMTSTQVFAPWPEGIVATAEEPAIPYHGEVKPLIRRFLLMGFNVNESANLTAYLLGIKPGHQWTARQLLRLLFVKRMDHDAH